VFSSTAEEVYSSLHKHVRPTEGRLRGIVVEQMASGWKAVLRTLGISILNCFSGNPVDWPSLKQGVAQSSVILFVSGDWTFVKLVIATVGNQIRVVAALTCGSVPKSGTWFQPQDASTLFSFSWHRIRHSDCDGLTSGSWFLGVNFAPICPFTPLPFKRRLRHVLKTTISGRKFEVPKEIDLDLEIEKVGWVDRYVHPGGLFPLEKPDALVIAPSIYTRWVTRPLSTDELLDLLDIPMDLRPSLISYSSTEWVFNSVPSKVLLMFSRWVLNLDTDQILSGGTPSKVSGNITTVLSMKDTDLPLQSSSMRQKAAKDDDASIPLHYWDEPFMSQLLQLGRPKAFVDQLASTRVAGACVVPVLEVLRSFVLCAWRKSVYTSFVRYMRREFGGQWYRIPSIDLDVGRDCLVRVTQADFWEWSGGSRLFFWRWPDESRLWARDGHPVYFSEPLPNYRQKQSVEPALDVRAKVTTKLKKFIDRGYVIPRRVQSLISYFTVPKGDSDVRLVFDGTKSGLNSALWAPSFHLPTIDSILPMLEPGFWQGDIDVGEQFYNYMLDPRIQPFCGLDVNPYVGMEDGCYIPWMVWARCVMGLRSSLHGCIKMQSLAEEVVRGDMSLPHNPFHFYQVLLNLPGDPNYNPCRSRVTKFNSRTGMAAGDMSTHVDDSRIVGPTFLTCWSVGHRVGTQLCYLGIQDALRKRSPPSQQAGAWTGTLAHSLPDALTVSCTQEKWEKARAFLENMQHILDQNGDFCHKTLEQQRGFLVYITWTYPSLVPFLRGIHLTLDSWRPGRDLEGWRSHVQVTAHFDLPQPELSSSTSPPSHVRPVPRLHGDVAALLSFFTLPVPPRRVVRAASMVVAIYGFGDASGAGFGSSIQTASGVSYRYGLWGNDLVGATSNYRELFNLSEAAEEHVRALSFHHLTGLVDVVSHEAAAGLLSGVEFFLFTDNGVAEAAFF